MWEGDPIFFFLSLWERIEVRDLTLALSLKEPKGEGIRISEVCAANGALIRA
jgi:hypothetical protein